MLIQMWCPHTVIVDLELSPMRADRLQGSRQLFMLRSGMALPITVHMVDELGTRHCFKFALLGQSNSLVNFASSLGCFTHMCARLLCSVRLVLLSWASRERLWDVGNGLNSHCHVQPTSVERGAWSMEPQCLPESFFFLDSFCPTRPSGR